MDSVPHRGDVEEQDTITFTLHRDNGDESFTGTVENVKCHLNHDSVREIDVVVQENDNMYRLKLYQSLKDDGAGVEVYNEDRRRIESDVSATFELN